MSSHKLRRIVGGTSLILFPLFLLVSEALDPAPRDSEVASLFDAAVEHEGMLVASAILLLASSVIMVPAIFALAQTIQTRGAGLIHAGVVFGLLGAFGHAMAAVYYLIVSSTPGGDRAEMIALLERIDASAAGAVVFPMILSFAVSILLLAFGAFRARAVGVAVPAAVVLAFVLEVAGPAFPEIFAVVKQALGLVAFGWMGVRILGMSDDQWARPAPVASSPRLTESATPLGATR